MDLGRLYHQFAEYHQRKWYPESYPDPVGALVDSVDSGTLEELRAELDSSRNQNEAALSLQLADLHPKLMHRSLVREADRFLEMSPAGICKPRFLLYYLRNLPPENASQLWAGMKEWAQQSRTPLLEWLQIRTGAQRSLAALRESALRCFALDERARCDSLESSLRATRDLYDWELRQGGPVSSLPDLPASFRMSWADSIADWSDFPALARNWADVCAIRKLPRLEASPEDRAVQIAVPVDPPSRVHLQYGTAAGPLDTYRFLRELGRTSCFLDLDMDLPFEQRILGDPLLPEFWGCLYANTLLRPTGLTRLVRPGAEDLAAPLQLAVRFYLRYDSVLALYHSRVQQDLKTAQDLYVALWETAYAFEPPHFLYLFDLERSGDALYRVLAFQAAVAAEDRLRSLYGNDWFVSPRCAARLRDYRQAGFRASLTDILADLDCSPSADL